MDGGVDPLDNIVWTALTTAQARFATGTGLARHYPRAAAPFSAIAEATPAAYADLAAGLPAGLEARLFRPADEPEPDGWETLSARPILQMVADSPSPGAAADAPIVALGAADLDAMLALAAATKPGPFAARTPELGRFFGVRAPRLDRLLAMVGERMRVPGGVELSALAVDPAARGRGLGAALARHLMRLHRAEGAFTILHVFPDNPASALYARLGFRERARPWVIWRRPRAATRAP